MMNSQNFSDAPVAASLKLTLRYLPPSLNQLHGRHWSARWKERSTAMAELWCAIDFAVADASTPTTLMPLLKRSQTYFADVALYRATTPKKSGLKLNKKELLIGKSSEPKSQSHGPKT